MTSERRGTEILVGAFLFIGFAFIAGMVVMFGRVGQGFKKTYALTVEFPNASGLLKDSDVLLAGARIGRVAEQPRLIGKSFTVSVKLLIRDDVKVPQQSDFVVGSSGLLGDRYVDVIPHENFDPSKTIPPDSEIKGTRMQGLDDLTRKGGVVMEQLKDELEAIKEMTASINEKLLSDANLKNLSETFAHLKDTSASLKESSKKLDPIFDKADAAVDATRVTMKTAEGVATDLKKAVANLEKAVDSANGFVNSGKTLLDKANRGQGALGLLLSDRETAENLRAFLANLRRSGPVFYKDREPRPVQQAPAPRRR
jgi:ABC-type transporter Mla subunit MlaD